MIGHAAIIPDSTWNVWRSEMGDFDPLGWATTAAYLLAAVPCARTAIAARRVRRDERGVDRPGAWWTLAAGMFALGLNKQLDLQIFVRESGKALVRLAGFEQQRRWIGGAFVVLLGILLVKVLATAAGQMRRSTRGHRLLLTGLALLAVFAVVRAGTYLPGLKRLNSTFADPIHFVFELGGIVLLALGAWRTRQRLVRHQSSSISSA